MPIYEYACKACGARMEAFQGIHDLPLTDCRHCHKPALEKLVSASLFRLKGGGWYETDFKGESDKKKNLAKSEENAPLAKSESGSETSEASPAAAPLSSSTPASGETAG